MNDVGYRFHYRDGTSVFLIRDISDLTTSHRSTISGSRAKCSNILQDTFPFLKGFWAGNFEGQAVGAVPHRQRDLSPHHPFPGSEPPRQTVQWRNRSHRQANIRLGSSPDGPRPH